MRLKTACGCMTVSTGTMVLGSLSIISSISLMIIMSIMMSQIDTKKFSADYLMIINAVYRTLMVYFPVVGASAALMIVGCVRRKSEYVFPWLALAFAGTVSSLSSYVASMIHSASTLPIGAIFLAILILAMATALQVYFWLIVYTLYKELLAEKYGYQPNPKSQGVIYSTPTYDA